MLLLVQCIAQFKYLPCFISTQIYFFLAFTILWSHIANEHTWERHTVSQQYPYLVFLNFNLEMKAAFVLKMLPNSPY